MRTLPRTLIDQARALCDRLGASGIAYEARHGIHNARAERLLAAWARAERRYWRRWKILK